MDAPPVPPRAVAAARRLVGPARVLRSVVQVLWVAGAVAAGLVALALAVALWRGEPTGVGIGIVGVLAVALFVPAWWLRHVRGTLADVVDLPRRLEALSAGRPRFSIDSREDVAALRTGGLLKAVRTIRATVGEVSDFVSPASTVIEVAAPPFWVWTAAATVATGVLSLLALVSLAYLVLG